jgi:hypothetical protein
MKKLLLVFLSLIATLSQASPLFSCFDEEIEVASTPYDIKLEVFRESPLAYSATLTFFQSTHKMMVIKQSSLYLWETYGAEVLRGSGDYVITGPDGEQTLKKALNLTISRMLTPERTGLVSIGLKFQRDLPSFNYISRSCK